MKLQKLSFQPENKTLPRRSLLLLSGVLLCAGSTPSLVPPAHAGVLNQLRHSISNLWGQSAANREDARAARDKASALNDKADTLHDKLEKSQQLLTRANEVYLNYSYQTKQTEARIVKTRHRVQIVTVRYDKHKKLFGQRLASIQRNGQLSYLNMILGSRTLSDMSRRMYLYQAIASSDSDLQNQLSADREELQHAQNELMSQWHQRNKLAQASVRERRRIVLAQADQQRYWKEIRSSVYAQLAYAQTKENTAKALVGDIQQLESRRAQIVADYQAQQRKLYASRPTVYRKKRVARKVIRTRYVPAEGGVLKPMPVHETVYEDVMVPVESGGSLGESFETDGGSSASSSSGWVRPARGRLSSRYGVRYHPILHRRKLHTGDDIAASYGSPIKAAKSGTVLYSGWKKGYGNTVIIDHGGGVTTLYGHASKLDVQAGQSVKAGAYVGNVGSTGYSTGPHLHFEVRKNGKPVDPTSYLKKSH